MAQSFSQWRAQSNEQKLGLHRSSSSGMLTLNSDQRLFHLLLHTLLAIAVYVLLHKLYFAGLRLPEEIYKESSFIVAASLKLQTWLVLLVPNALLYVKHRQIKWSKISQGAVYRFFIGSLALVIAYAFSGYDFNFFFDQGHYIDRVIVLVALLLTVCHSAFLPLFLTVSIITAFQFSYPLGAYTFTDKRILFDMLILFNVFLLFRTFIKHDFKLFLFLALCLHAAAYFISGVGKLMLNWMSTEQLDNLFVSSYVNGWLSNVDVAIILEVARIVNEWNVFLVIGTLIFELAALFIFSSKKFAIVLLIATIGMHISIFLLSGIFFWKWILLNGAFLVGLTRFDTAYIDMLFRKPRHYLYLSLIVIGCAPLYFRPPVLAWIDTRLNTIYELEAIGESGAVYPVARGALAPYDAIFSQNRFYYIHDEPVLVGTFGATINIEIAEMLEHETDTLEEIDSLALAVGHNYFDESKGARFDYFIATFFQHINERRGEEVITGFVPHHIWNQGGQGTFRGQEIIDLIRVKEKKIYYDDDTIRVLKEQVIRYVDIAN